jgi:DNA-binding winged helix-turn-helix (wHTH) protein
MRHTEARGGYSYEFGPYCLNPLERLLTKGGAPVPLSPKAFEVLLFFVRNKGKALSKDELMKAGWGDTFVEEANLTQTISVLRKVLGEGLDERVYIETIPKHGYRFRLPVESKPVVIPIAPDDRRLDRRKLFLGLIGAGALLVVLGVLVVAHRPTTGPALLSVAPSFVPLVTDPGVRLYPSWAPDSKKIAFVGEVNGHLQVFTRALGSPMSTQVTNQNDDCIHPFWSSDGTHIYFGAGANLWRVGANGGQPTLVMPRVFQASLSPDDSALAFIAAETGLGSLFISKTPGRSAEALYGTALRESAVSRSRDSPLFAGRKKVGRINHVAREQTRILAPPVSGRQACRASPYHSPAFLC